MRMEMVQAKELIYEYEKRDEEGNVIGMSRAIDGVDLDVLPGQFVAILGHNGSGKSTLAKQINAILVPSGGTMWVDGRDTRDPDHRDCRGRRCGVRSGKFGRADRRNLDTGGRKLKGSRDDRIPLPFPE